SDLRLTAVTGGPAGQLTPLPVRLRHPPHTSTPRVQRRPPGGVIIQPLLRAGLLPHRQWPENLTLSSAPTAAARPSHAGILRRVPVTRRHRQPAHTRSQTHTRRIRAEIPLGAVRARPRHRHRRPRVRWRTRGAGRNRPERVRHHTPLIAGAYVA